MRLVCTQGVLNRARLALLVLTLPGCSLRIARASTNESLNLAQAVVLATPTFDAHESATLKMLQEEAAKRDGVVWKIESADQCKKGHSCILIGRHDQLINTFFYRSLGRIQGPPLHAESFEVEVVRRGSQHLFLVDGRDDRGVLYGVGYLLRHLNFAAGKASYVGPQNVASFPQFEIRGHQLGYRFKNNTYDAWTPERFEQYIRDLAVFGTNTLEILPPITDDAPSSPLFPLPPMEMMTRISTIVQKYGLRCSVYYPAIAKDYSDPATVQSELQVWSDVFAKLPQVDELFIPGGDPGHTDPDVLFPFLAKVTEQLHRYHPQATVWVSAQGFNADQMKRFYSLVNARPKWLTGIVFGPQSRDSLGVQRAIIDKRFPIRFYPDIAHSMHAQLPVPQWDEAYALTEGREIINPRPVDEATIFRHFAPYMSGFVTYSEGVNDDVNKFIWSALGWSASASVEGILKEYARYFVGDAGFESQQFAQGLADVEKNWIGPLRLNPKVRHTLREFQTMEHAARSTQLRNWRFEAALYRAYTDAYEQQRLIEQSDQQEKALQILAQYPQSGSIEAIRMSERALSSSKQSEIQLRPMHQQIEQLASNLFRDIGIQLSVKKFGASAVDRGASLDTLDVDLNDRAWLENQFSIIRRLDDEQHRRSALDALLHWSDAGPAGFYDNLGDPLNEPHLVRGPGYPTDPAFFQTAQDGIADRIPEYGWRLSQISYAGALYDHPLELRYGRLDPSARYKLRIEYAGEDYTVPISLIADGRYLIHGPHLRKSNPELDEYSIPPQATSSGTLDLKWTRPVGLGGGGRGLQVAEVWLIRVQ